MHGTGTTTMSMVQQDPTIVTTMVRLTMSIVMITVQQTGITTMTTALPIGTLRTIMVLPTGITTTTTVQQTGTTTMTTVLPIGHMKSRHMTGHTRNHHILMNHLHMIGTTKRLPIHTTGPMK